MSNECKKTLTYVRMSEVCKKSQESLRQFVNKRRETVNTYLKKVSNVFENDI